MTYLLIVCKKSKVLRPATGFTDADRAAPFRPEELRHREPPRWQRIQDRINNVPALFLGACQLCIIGRHKGRPTGSNDSIGA